MKYRPKTIERPKAEVELTRKDIRELLGGKELSTSDVVVKKTSDDESPNPTD